MAYFVYIHTCPNKKKYICIHEGTHPKNRWRSNGRGYKKQIFYRAIEKYGWNNIDHKYFEVSTRGLMKFWEKVLIYHYKSNDPDYGYNLTDGGESASGRIPWNKGHKWNEHPNWNNIKESISNANKGKRLSREHLNILKSIPVWNKGKHMSNESRLKISESNKGRKRTDEFKKRRSDYMKEYWKKKKESK